MRRDTDGTILLPVPRDPAPVDVDEPEHIGRWIAISAIVLIAALIGGFL